MKKTKVIIPALGLLLLSTAASVTGTVAWFSANATVTASGMQVTAVSDNFFLEISTTQDGAYAVSAAASLEEDVKPTAHEADLDEDEIVDATNWYYQYSDSLTVYNSNLTDPVALSSFTGYVAVQNFYVKLNGNGITAAHNLYVSEVTFSAANAGLRLAVVGADGLSEHSASAQNIAYAEANRLAENVTDTAQLVQALIWIEGNDSNVTTSNIEALTGSVSFKLTVSA